MKKKTKIRYILFLSAITMVVPVLSDETIYNSKDIILADVNNSIFGTIFDKPFKESYPLAQKIKSAQWFHVDIRNFCNMGFLDKKADDDKGGWTDSGPIYDLHPFGPGYGIIIFYGVPFDIIDPAVNNNLTMITMRSGWKKSSHYPEHVKIPINNKSTALFFLHASSWADAAHGMGASRNYEVIYKDGSVERIPIICAGGHENMANWMWSPSGGTPLLNTSSAKPVPVHIDKATRYLFTLEWLNPHPEKEIARVDIVTRDDKKWFTIVLLAITGVSTDNGEK